MGSERTLVDCHVHLPSTPGVGGMRADKPDANSLRDSDQISRLAEIADAVSIERANIVCTNSRNSVNANPAAFVAKAEHQGRFYVFAGLDHSTHFTEGAVRAPTLAEQVDRLKALGADGIKMIENKPTARKTLDIPVDGPYFADYFARAEETGFPILWHVNDPEEFWDPETTPSWALSRGWGYDETFVDKETLYAEVEHVLGRHPKLRIIFAHFYFLSADLPRAAELLDRFEGVSLDLAPGIEMLYNMSGDNTSRNLEAARDFFVRYADRIVFGTDISSTNTVAEAKIRAGIVTRWLETDETYRVPAGADFLLGPPEDGIMRGLGLPEEVLSRVLRGNFERIAGERPKPLDVGKAREECERIAREIDAIAGGEAEDNHAAKAARRLL